MKYEQLWKDIETLCALRGPSGREAAVREYLIEQIKGHAEYEVDPLGNLLVRKKGKNPAKKVLQLSAHMDEVGFIITNIDEKGFLSFAPVGGWQPCAPETVRAGPCSCCGWREPLPETW